MITVISIVSSILWGACTVMLAWAFFTECPYKREVNNNLLEIKNGLKSLSDSLNKLGSHNVSLGDDVNQLIDSVKIQREMISALINEVQKIAEVNKKNV